VSGPDHEGLDDLRAEVRQVLGTPAVRAALAAVRAGGPEPDVRPLYRELAARGLLAVGWPVEYGGRGLGHAQAAAVAEELVRGGVPDMLHVLSIQIVGLFLLQAGSAEQKARLLPELAAARRFATVLYTEPEVGSDLAALRTTAVRDQDGYLVSGTKVYGLKSGQSDLALCAVRTAPGATKYDGISLMLVDLRAPGVHRSTISSIADERFDHVHLDSVRVSPADLLSGEGEGWSLLTRCLAIERTGLDYSLKAERWYTAAVAGLDPATADAALVADVGRHGAAVAAGRLLAWDAIGRLDTDRLDPAVAAMAKYHTSETAQEVATWAALVHGAGYGLHRLDPTAAAVLEAGFREAPGLTISAGTSEIMLEMVASSALDQAPDTGEDPVLRRIGRSVADRLARVDPAGPDAGPATLAALADQDAFAYEAPVEAGGFDLGLACGTRVAAELGRRALPDIYTGSLLAVEALADREPSAVPVSDLVAGKTAALPAGFDLLAAGREAAADAVVVDGAGLSAAHCVLPVLDGTGATRIAVVPAGDWERAAEPAPGGLLRLPMRHLEIDPADLVPAADVASLLARARLRHAGYLLGLGEGALELAVRYAADRQQFDRPILANQAVAFRLARLRIELYGVRLAVADAASRLDAGRSAELAALQALAAAAETALRTVRSAVQVHGARGLSHELSVHAYLSRARTEVTRFGTPADLWREAGSRRLAGLRTAAVPALD
jgi:alkylation response protein AidB-like acyl-CoA dehydrogenase